MAASWPRPDILLLVLVKKGPFSESDAAVAASHNVVAEFGCNPGSTRSSTGLCQAFAPLSVVASSTGSASAVLDSLDTLRIELPTPTGNVGTTSTRSPERTCDARSVSPTLSMAVVLSPQELCEDFKAMASLRRRFQAVPASFNGGG
jgi:hypothetical protein